MTKRVMERLPCATPIGSSSTTSWPTWCTWPRWSRRRSGAATTALLEADLKLAEQVITEDQQLDAKQAEIESRAFSLLARQAPVAGELRTLVATLRMVTELERMGDLAAHVAKIARLRYPESAVPSSLRANFVRMADVAEKMVVTAGQTLNDRNIQTAQELRDRDEEMDDLRRSPVPGAAQRRLVARRRGRGRRGPARPLLRADRRPRRLDGPPDHLRRDRFVPRSRGLAPAVIATEQQIIPARSLSMSILCTYGF